MNPHLELAKGMALKSLHKVRVGAVVVWNKRARSAGYNQLHKTHPLLKVHRYPDLCTSLHAEMHACLGVPAKNLRGASIFVVRLTSSGEVAVSRPCKHCLRFLSQVGIKFVWYATSKDQAHLMDLRGDNDD